MNNFMPFKFAHIADVHIGSWREEKLRELGVKAFEKAVDICIAENVDFLLISGDLFNTSMPPIDKIKAVVIQLNRLKENKNENNKENKDENNKGNNTKNKEKPIPVYVIAGSHDFSPSGKTMLDVLEEAGLFVNVVKGTVENNKLKLKFTTDKKTGIKITGMLGKKGMLEKSFYEALDRESLENEKNENSPKIFMFHTALTEFKPKEMASMESSPLSLLPKGFDYYAGGHVHYIFQKDETEQGYGLVAFPGALFPCNFKEIEEFKCGGIYIVNFSDKKKIDAEWKPIKIINVESIFINCKDKTAEAVEKELKEKIEDLEKKDEKQNKIKNSIITLRLEGNLSIGRISDINFNEIIKSLYSKGAFFVMKNTTKLLAEKFEEANVQYSGIEEIEDKIISEHIGQIKIEGLTPEKEKELAKELLSVFSIEKDEGEKNDDFEKRVIENAERALFELLKR